MDTATTITRNDAALLRLIWLASPALPVGGFSYSEGLEAAVEAGHVHDENSAAAWLVDQLHLAQARADIAVVAHAVVALREHRNVEHLDAWVRETRETSELRLQVDQMGRSLGEWARGLGAPATSSTATAPPRPAEGPAHTYPVAFAVAASGTTATVREIALAYAFGWSENMVQAAVKAVPLGQNAGQRILQRLAAEIPSAVDNAVALHEDERQSFSPMLAILSSQHEVQYSRLFRS